MKKITHALLAALAVVSVGLNGCGSSSSGSSTTQAAATTVSLSGSLEPGAAKATLKTVGAATAAIGTVSAIDAATGSVLSATPADILPDSTGTGGTFSGLTFTPPSTQAGIILKATLSNGKVFRSLITSQLSAQSAPITVSAIGPNSEAIITKVSSSLNISGVLGDTGVSVPVGTKLADLASTATSVTTAILPSLQTGYVVDTGGSSPAIPGISLIDRVTKTVLKTVRFTNQAGTRVGHFANATADGSEIWDCSGQGASAGVMNVYNSAAFKTYSTLNDSNKGSFVKFSFAKGCGVQNVLSPDGKYIFASVDQSPKGVNVFDVKNHAYLGNITNGNTAPHVGAVSADGKKYYTTNSFHAVGYDISGLPAVVPTDANKVLDVNLGYGSLHAVRLHPNGKYLFVGNNTWPVPSPLPSTISAATSGLNVIDIATQKIIATIPGRPHNYAISPDGRYLLSTELSSPDCEVTTPGDPGNLLQFIDISTLLTATPDPSKIKAVYQLKTPGFGGSHAAWDPTTGLLYYSVIDNVSSEGWLLLLDTSNLSAATPSVTQIGDKHQIGWAPHGVFFPGIDGD